MPTTPPTEGLAPLQRLARARESFEALPDARRWLIFVGLALTFGLVAMPFLVWFAGNRALGPYTHGENAHAGPFALLIDYYTGLLHGSAVFWGVALGPAALLLLMRGFVALWRHLPAGN